MNKIMESLIRIQAIVKTYNKDLYKEIEEDINNIKDLILAVITINIKSVNMEYLSNSNTVDEYNNQLYVWGEQLEKEEFCLIKKVTQEFAEYDTSTWEKEEAEERFLKAIDDVTKKASMNKELADKMGPNPFMAKSDTDTTTVKITPEMKGSLNYTTKYYAIWKLVNDNKPSCISSYEIFAIVNIKDVAIDFCKKHSGFIFSEEEVNGK